MAWYQASGRTNEELVNNLNLQGVIKTQAVKNAMLAVDRGYFAPFHPYMDNPQPIGFGATISAPHMHAHACEVLKDKLKPGAKVLDVGSGTGYLTAVFSVMVGETGKVIGIEHIDELVRNSIKNIRNWNSEVLETGHLQIITGDGRKGYEREAPYDAIHVGAAVSEIPQALIDQLAKGGRMVLPVGHEYSLQFLTRVDKKHDGSIEKHRLCDVMYVPLTDKEKQIG